jgi:hypothetical protein
MSKAAVKVKPKLVECFNCNAGITDEDMHHEICMATDSDVHTICDDCMAEMVKCSDCEEYLPKCDATVVDEDEWVCEACMENYNKCTDCGGYFSDDNFVCDHGNNMHICQGCYENNYFTCEDCCHICHVDYYGEDGHCGECWKDNHEHEENVAEPEPELNLFNAMLSGPKMFAQSTSLVHFECAVKTFYLMYALEERLHRKRSDLGHIVKKELTVFSNKFARALFDYMALASIGEARNAKWIPAEMMIDGFFSEANRPDRAFVYQALAHTVDPIASAPALSAVFGSNWREKGYGGNKWKSIVDAYATYPDRISDIAFIDMAVNKRHNGSLAFDKGIIFRMPGGQYSILPFLDFRRECDALELLTVTSNTANFFPITPRLFELLECAVRERVIPAFPTNIKLVDIKWYPPVKWGDIVLEARDNERYESPDEKEEEEMCSDCEHPMDDCQCNNLDEGGECGQKEEQTEEYYDGKYSEYRQTVKGLGNMEGRTNVTA